MDTLHAFSNHVKETLDDGLSIDWGDLKRETTNHGCSLMEVDWGGKIKPNHTTSECMLSEVDWGAHDSSCFSYLVHIDHDGEQTDLFTQGLKEGLPQEHLPPLLWHT